MTKQLVLIALFLSTTALAESNADSVRCRKDRSQAELNVCAAEDFAAADKELNGVYKKILVEYKDEPLFLEKLKAAQKLWIKLRGAEIEAMYPVSDSEKNSGWISGSAYIMGVDYYAAELTRERTQHLRAWLDGVPEGDVSGGSIHFKKN